MIRKALAVAVLSLALASEASAWNDILNSIYGPKGNDTGGIIPWSPENERLSFAIAEEQCGRWNKYPVATSIHRVPGDYIAYRCVWEKPYFGRVRHHRRVNVNIAK